MEIFLRNIKHFGPTKQTTFATPPISDILGNRGINQVANNVYDSNKEFPSTQKQTDNIQLIFDNGR
jgi:hypothetical protein